MKQITLDGTYVLQIMKGDDGEFSSILMLQKKENGFIPVLDCPVKVLQENKNIGVELEFNADNITIS